MKNVHTITDSLFEEMQLELGRGNHWVAYDQNVHTLDNKDMYFFTFEDEARTFAEEYSFGDEYFAVLQATTAISLMRQLPYDGDIHFNLTPHELEELFQSFDWAAAHYDPLRDNIEASTEAEKNNLARMETLVTEWENLYHQDPERALDLAARYWEGHPMENYKNDFLILNFDLMNERNFDYLKSNIRNHGFGETLAPALETALKAGQAEFTLAFKTEVNKHEMDATLYFRRSNDTDMYFFNKYDTRLKNEKDETVSQTFYINNGWGVTLKEAYNLLNGRAVHKELTDKDNQKYQSWIQLDFGNKDKNGNFERKQYHQNYGYDLKEALSYYPIKEMLKEEDSKNLTRSLERGNLQQVTIDVAGKETKVFIEANPQYKNVNIYSSQMQRLDQEQRSELMKQPGSVSGQVNNKNTETDQSQDNGKEKDKKQNINQSNDNNQQTEKGKKKPSGQQKGGEGLIEKKRTNGKKGLSH